MPEIELVGGIYDGKRIQVPEIRDHWLMPVAPDLSFSFVPDDVMPEMPPPPLVYERAGIRDDGTDWYRLR